MKLSSSNWSILIGIVFASFLGFLTSCSRQSIVVCWSDEPDTALFAELYNSKNRSNKIEFHYKKDLIDALYTEHRKPDIVIGEGINSTGKEVFSALPLVSKNSSAYRTVYPDFFKKANNKGRCYVPLSFNLPTLVVKDIPTNLDNSIYVSFDSLKETHLAFSRKEGNHYTNLAFSPRWDLTSFQLLLRYKGADFRRNDKGDLIRTQPTLRSSPYRCARARTSVRLSLSDRKTAPSYALRCPPSTPGVKKRPPEPSPRPSGPRPT